MTKKDFSRREFIKYVGKIGIGATIWGTVGNLIGRIYQGGKDIYKEDINPKLEKIGKSYDKLVETSSKTKDILYDDPKKYWSKKFGFKRKEKIPPSRERVPTKKPKKITRKGFFDKFLRYFHNHPVGTATTIGTSYGMGKSSIKRYGKYKTKEKEISRRKKLEGIEKLLNQILEKMENGQQTSSKLEKDTISPKRNRFLIALGIIGITMSAIFSSSNLTGYTIINNAIVNSSNTIIIIFVVSLILIFLGSEKD